MQIIIKATIPEFHDYLQAALPEVTEHFTYLRELYPQIILPDMLTLRSVRRRPGSQVLTLGRAGVSPVYGWYIALRPGMGAYVRRNAIAEEVAHIGEARLTKTWRHNHLWRKIYNNLLSRGER